MSRILFVESLSHPPNHVNSYHLPLPYSVQLLLEWLEGKRKAKKAAIEVSTVGHKKLLIRPQCCH